MVHHAHVPDLVERNGVAVPAAGGRRNRFGHRRLITGPEARVGPPLTGVGSRLMLGGVLPNTPENMVRWIRAPQQHSPLTAMPDLGVTERDAVDIAAYLAKLK
jgi:cytochrome c1